MFWKKKRIIDLGRTAIIEEPVFDSPEEERVSRNYAAAKTTLERLGYQNTNGLTAMQQAKQEVDYQVARDAYDKAYEELLRYATQKNG